MPTKKSYILQRSSNRDNYKGYVEYVREMKGVGGKDWGWVSESSLATPVSEHWKMRFLADANHCQWRGAQAVEISK
jgi:hypothetical protein